MKLSGIYYIILLGILCLGLWFFLLRETPSQTEMTFDDSNTPKVDRLCIPIKLDVAKTLFVQPQKERFWELSTKREKNLFIIKGKEIKSILSSISINAEALEKLQKDFGIVTLADDCSTLTFRIDKDEATGEEYINVPAGLLRAYIK